jgi:hypothetical protein
VTVLYHHLLEQLPECPPAFMPVGRVH